MLREDEFADDLLRAFEVALKEYAAGDQKLAYQLCSPFGPYLATRVPKVAAPAPAARASSGGARASKGGVNAVPVPAPASVTGAEDDESDGEVDETVEVGGRAKRAKPLPAPPKHSETRAPDEKKKRRSGPSGVSGARKAARAAAEVTAAAAEAAAAGQAPPPPPGPRAVETALRTENGELKVQLAKVNEECMSLKGQLAAMKATVELREQLAVATAKAACGGLMLRAMTNLGGGGARAGPSGVHTPGGEDTPVGASIQQQLAFDAFFGSR